MKGWTNYHSHTHYCDGKGTAEEYISRAVALGMISYGISSHAPTPFTWPWTMKKEAMSDYFTEIQDCKAKYLGIIDVYSSLEVDFIPGVVSVNSDWIIDADLDYSIGSVHFVDAFEDGTPWEIDGASKVFEYGLQSIFGGDAKAAVQRYFALTRQMIQEAPPTIVGHLDKIKMQNGNGLLFNENDRWYQKEIIETLEAVKEKGLMLEINTRGLYKKKTTTSYPSPWVFRYLKDMSIPIMINSDSHHTQEMTGFFIETAEQLISAGLTQVMVLLNNDWQEGRLTVDGIEV
ncbi:MULTISPECIES: histidinol-phosphatase [unclassified Imperialibacter]|uniref:histidinol-phosphatase n=1 Tax=unclassified Imperialibacter TaxID=2629706 RepID=UPI001255A8A6|nr:MULTISPECIES: histidinol-phosphatase [unclassified Imperialibacter]CAD5280900.1 Histidinol-phosphatase [Imperialibacter sp. 75]CAD5287462.1 Histidinol-phosphatase [Imperialibacter sp. 89]VVT27828.1 Histidinol-phosphatase (PHP family) [Imperialibacter sp. EC-SDR9]